MQRQAAFARAGDQQRFLLASARAKAVIARRQVRRRPIGDFDPGSVLQRQFARAERSGLSGANHSNGVVRGGRPFLIGAHRRQYGVSGF